LKKEKNYWGEKKNRKLLPNIFSPQICEDGVLVIIWLRRETKKKVKEPLIFLLGTYCVNMKRLDCDGVT
jgi:hypothetical protein